MLFFTSPVVFLSGIVFDSLSDIGIEHVDLMDGETENESELKTPIQTPTEEEQEHTPFVISIFQNSNENNTLWTMYSAFWDNVSLPIPTEPPEQAV